MIRMPSVLWGVKKYAQNGRLPKTRLARAADGCRGEKPDAGISPLLCVYTALVNKPVTGRPENNGPRKGARPIRGEKTAGKG